MKKVGFIGWRGMVGSVLIQRMLEEGDFEKILPVFFTSSQYGKLAPKFGQSEKFLKSAFDLNELESLDIIVSCQGNDYTKNIYPKLRKIGWIGYWLDSSSALRMCQDSVIVLDPINYKYIKNSIDNGVKNFICGNCIVNLMLIALGGLFKEKLIDWVYVSTYQAISGAGSKILNKLFNQISQVGYYIFNHFSSLSENLLFIERKINNFIKTKQKNDSIFSRPYFSNLFPWIDEKAKTGQTKEELKLKLEVNKVLNNKDECIPIDGICVRIDSFRCHSQSLLLKLKRNISIKEIKKILVSQNNIVKIVPNELNSTIDQLTPMVISGTLDVFIGRLRKLNIGKKYLSAFTIGDQLLWGASEPLRRILLML